MSERQDNDHPLYRKAKGASPIAVKRAPTPRRPREDQPLLTYVLMAVNALLFLLGYISPELEWELFLRGALIPQFVVANGEVYRLATAMFLHGSLGHVFFNVYALYVVGSSVEPIFGRARFLLIYLLGGLTGSALSLLLGGLEGASVGASGAVFAIFAAEAAHLYQHRGVYANVRGRLRHMAFLIAVNLFIGFMPGSRIDNWGHIGGMLGGALLAWRIAPRMPRPALPPPSMRDFARTDVNPLSRHWLYLAGYAVALVAIVFAAIMALAP